MKFWATLLTLALLIPSLAEAGKDRKEKRRKARRGEAIEQQTPETPPATVNTWPIYEAALAHAEEGRLDEAARGFEEAAQHPSLPIVWCYSRLHLADVYFRQGNHPERHAPEGESPQAVREARYAAARTRFDEALVCAGKRPVEPGSPEAPGPLGEAEIEAVEEFKSFGTDDLAGQLEAVSARQGRALLESGDTAAAREHWKLHFDALGPSRGAHLDLGMTCLELGDLACARENVLAADALPETDWKNPTKPLESAIRRAFALAAEPVHGSSTEGEDGNPPHDTGRATPGDYHAFALDLLTWWHGDKPLERTPKDIVAEFFVPLEREERLRRLRTTDACWIPLHVVEKLQEQEADYIEEARIASDCDPDGATAREALALAYYLEAKNAWNSLRPLSKDEFQDARRVGEHVGTVEAVLENLEQALTVEKEYPLALQLKAKVVPYLDQMRTQRKDILQVRRAERHSYCQQQWGSFSWWSKKKEELLSETPSLSSVEEFRRECGDFIREKGIGRAVQALREDIEDALRAAESETRGGG